jgi:hypothetical protein
MGASVEARRVSRDSSVEGEERVSARVRGV